MCSYNGEEFLDEQLRSMARQSRLPDELVICDDHSMDSTTTILRRFADDAPFPVRLFFNTSRLGINPNFERAISLCRGDVIVLADQDNVWSSNKLERIEQIFAARNSGLVCSDADIVDRSLQPLGQTIYELQGSDPRFRRRLEVGPLPQLFSRRRAPYGFTLAFRSVLRDLIAPLPSFPQTLAYDIWIDLIAASVSPVVALEDRLQLFRQHPDQYIGVRRYRLAATPPRQAAARSAKHLNASLRQPGDYSWSLWLASQLLARLGDWSPPAGLGLDDWSGRAAKSRSYLSDKIHHLTTRDDLATRRAFGRVPTVASELMSGRYHRHSRGAASAIKDLIRQTYKS